MRSIAGMWGLFLLFAGCVFPASLQGQPPQVEVKLTVEERNWIRDRPKIRLMVVPHYEPADFVDEVGNHRGIAADMLAILSERTGLQIEPVPLTADQSVELDPKKRGVDGVALSAQTSRRAEYYLATTPYLVFPAYIIARRSTDRYWTPADLIGRSVAVVKGYAAQEYLETNYPNLQLDLVADTDVGLRKLSFGEVQAFVSDIPVSTYWLEKEGFANLKIVGDTGYIYRLGILSRKDEPVLHSILQKGLDSISYSERDAIRRKWLNLDYQPLLASRRFWTPVAWVALVGLILLLLAMLWNRSLSRTVHERTQELEESKSLLQNCLEQSSDAVLQVRPDGSLARVWSAANNLFGLPPEQLMKRTVEEIFGPEFAKTATDSGANGLRNAVTSVLDRSQQPRQLLVNIIRVPMHPTDSLYVCRDVTEYRRMEDRLARKQRLETVGLLAGGLAHDFNNIIQVILGYTEMAQDVSANPVDRRTYLDEVQTASGRARGLVHQLLAFSGERNSDRQKHELNALFGNLRSLLRQLIGPSNRLEFEPFPEHVEANINASEIERVIINLCANARDAMPDGGTVRLRVACTQIGSDSTPNPLALASGRYAILTVQDDGAGMDEAVMARLFEPYFTTKSAENGTGLGLAVAYKVIEDHGGQIEVKSEPGHGSTFAVYLPLAESATVSPEAGT